MLGRTRRRVNAQERLELRPASSGKCDVSGSHQSLNGLGPCISLKLSRSLDPRSDQERGGLYEKKDVCDRLGIIGIRNGSHLSEVIAQQPSWPHLFGRGGAAGSAGTLVIQN
jgi:hypothetical protein